MLKNDDIFNNGIIFQFGRVHIQAQDQWTTSIKFPLTYKKFRRIWIFSNSTIHCILQNGSLSGSGILCYERTSGGWASTDYAFWYSIGS